MKKNILKALLVCFVAVFASCSSDDDNNDSVSGAIVRVEVNGALYESSTVIAAMGNGNRYFEFDSVNGNSEAIQLRLGDFNDTTAPILETGFVYTYSNGDTSDASIFYQDQSTNTIVGGSTTGTQITITSLDVDTKTISGTFSGEFPDQTGSISLVNGVFTNIIYTE